MGISGFTAKGSIQAGVTQICPGDAHLGISADSGAAKTYLRSILCPNGSYGGAGPDGTINGLDGKFAICAANFLKTATQKGIGVCINEGYRTVATQNAYAQAYLSGKGGVACTKGAACEHPRGIAIDVNRVPASDNCADYQPLFNLAPQFGLTFYLGCKDKVHFVPAKGGCDAAGNIPPNNALPTNTYDFPQYYTPPPANAYTPYSQSPFGGSYPSNTTNPLFSPQSPFAAPLTNPTLNPSTNPLVSPSSPTSCTPQFSCVGTTIYFQSSSCASQVYQTCQYGCSGNVCAPAPAASTSAPTITPSVLDVLTATIANPFPLSSTTTASSSPLNLNPGLFTVVQATSSSASGSNGNSAANYDNYGFPSVNTFTSPDLSTTYNPNLPAAPLSQLLQSLKTLLSRFLVILQPAQSRTQ